MKKILLSTIVLGFMVSNAYGICDTTTCIGKIDKLFMSSGGTLYVGTDGDEKALDCAAGAGNGGVSGVYMSLKEGDVGKNAMYSLLLTAKTTGTPVSIRVETGSVDCRVLYVTY